MRWKCSRGPHTARRSTSRSISQGHRCPPLALGSPWPSVGDRHRRVGCPFLLGECPGRGSRSGTCSPACLAPGRLHHLPRRDLPGPTQLGRKSLPRSRRELRDLLASHKAGVRHSRPSDSVLATATGKVNARSDTARYIDCAVAEETTQPRSMTKVR